MWCICCVYSNLLHTNGILSNSYKWHDPSQQLHFPIICPLRPFLTELGRWLSASTREPRETAFLYQRLSITVQRFNAVLIQETFDLSDRQPDLIAFSSFYQFLNLVFSPWILAIIVIISRQLLCYIGPLANDMSGLILWPCCWLQCVCSWTAAVTVVPFSTPATSPSFRHSSVPVRSDVYSARPSRRAWTVHRTSRPSTTCCVKAQDALSSPVSVENGL